MKMRLCNSLAVCIALACSTLAANAVAAEHAQLRAGFSPEKLGKRSTVSIAFNVGAAQDPTVAHLTSMDLRLPNGVTNGFNTLGPETCTAAMLELSGLAGCPSNSVVGDGTATVSVRLGSETLLEHVGLTILMAPSHNEQTELLFYSTGTMPVISQLVFKALLLGDSGPFGALIEAGIPPIPALPGAPDAALIAMDAVIAPKSLRYHKREHGAIVTYTPEGFDTPPSCPASGFPFAATFNFSTGATESAAITVPCPGARSAQRSKRGS